MVGREDVLGQEVAGRRMDMVVAVAVVVTVAVAVPVVVAVPVAAAGRRRMARWKKVQHSSAIISPQDRSPW